MERDSLTISGRCESTHDFGHGELGGVRPCNARVVGILPMKSCCSFVRKNVCGSVCQINDDGDAFKMAASTPSLSSSLGSIGQEFFIYMN